VELAEQLQRIGNDARLVALTGDDTASTHDVMVLGNSRRSRSVLSGLRSMARGADVVVAHGSATLEACAIALAASSTPFVYRTIGEPSYWASTRARRIALAVLHQRAARHVVLWKGAAEQLMEQYGLSPAQIDVIPNAVPGDRWTRATRAECLAARLRHGVPNGQPCLAFVGALSPEKDVDAVLEVANVLPEAVVLIAGTGPERSRLEARAGWIDPARIHFLGSIPDPWSVYVAADLLLLPSLSEGMPAVIIEAGLVGTASVATSVGAVPELISDGLSGFLARPGDHRGFAEAVRAALPFAAGAGSRAAEGLRQSFTIEAVAPRWSQAMARACGG
jgi:glycosyltransferase involved in cell wall biosynthesis